MFGLSNLLEKIADSRPRPQIPTSVAATSVLVMFLSRPGSLHSIEQLKGSKALRDIIGGDLPSADSLGRIMDLIDPSSIRLVLHQLYSILKSNKVLIAPEHGFVSLVLDGHESHCSYRRHCEGCLARKKVVNGKEVVQYYHRNVTAQLIFKDFKFLLDAEKQQPGEGELTCAIRLLERVLHEYSRSFHLVVMDGLYARSNIFNLILSHQKHAIAVLKDERRDLLNVANGAFQKRAPDRVFETNDTEFRCWEHKDGESWSQVNKPVRVIRSIESRLSVHNQVGRTDDALPTSWTWVTTLPAEEANIKTIVEIAHSRWAIENEGFNELVNHWHADHVYKHGGAAIQNFWLMAMIAYNLFKTFYLRNLKPAARRGKTMLHFARAITSELYYFTFSCGIPP